MQVKSVQVVPVCIMSDGVHVQYEPGSTTTHFGMYVRWDDDGTCEHRSDWKVRADAFKTAQCWCHNNRVPLEELPWMTAEERSINTQLIEQGILPKPEPQLECKYGVPCRLRMPVDEAVILDLLPDVALKDIMDKTGGLGTVKNKDPYAKDEMWQIDFGADLPLWWFHRAAFEVLQEDAYLKYIEKRRLKTAFDAFTDEMWCELEKGVEKGKRGWDNTDPAIARYAPEYGLKVLRSVACGSLNYTMADVANYAMFIDYVKKQIKSVS